MQIGLPVVIIGMHLCGHLSTIAIDLFLEAELAGQLVLCPCCLPPANSDHAPPQIYTTKKQYEQYQRWVEHLDSLLSQCVPTEVCYDSRMLSERCAILHSKKSLHRPPFQNPLAGLIAAIKGPCWALEASIAGSDSISSSDLKDGKAIEVSVNLTNVGGTAGDQSIASFLTRDLVEGSTCSSSADPQQPLFFQKFRRVAPEQKVSTCFKLKPKHFMKALPTNTDSDCSELAWCGEYQLIVKARIKCDLEVSVCVVVHNDHKSD